MLDKRLSACMSLVSGDVACDVGTDHGYLPAELLTSGKCRFCYACDINEMPLKSAEKTLSSINMDGKWRCILSDGLKAADDEALSDITDIICAGMGGELISQIIGNSHTAKKARLILQPMTQAAFLRRYLCENVFRRSPLTAENTFILYLRRNMTAKSMIFPISRRRSDFAKRVLPIMIST